MLRSLRSNPLRYRWLLWGMLSVSFLLMNLYRLSSAVLAEQLMVAFDTTGAQLGTLHASFFYIYAVMQIPSGILADRLGPRYTVTAGALVMNVGVLWFVATESYAAGFLARTLIGLGGSVIFISILRFCANWYRATEFATMNGMTLAVSGVGGILATTPLALAVTAIGWRSTLGVLAGRDWSPAASRSRWSGTRPRTPASPPLTASPGRRRSRSGRPRGMLWTCFGIGSRG